MGLPKLEVPVLECELPISKEVVKYRPYTVKEENVMNLVTTEKDPDKLHVAAISALARLVEECTFNNVNINNLPMIDFEYLFLKISIASSGSIRKKIYSCQAKIDDKTCNKEIALDIDLDQVECHGEMPDPIVKLTDQISLKLKLPGYESIKRIISNKTNEEDALIKTVASSVEMVIYGEEVYTEFDQQELIDNILSNMTAEQGKGVQDFYDNVPTLKYKTEITCPKCKTKHPIEIDNVLSFFV